MGVRERRAGVLVGVGCVLAGVGPFVVPDPAMQRWAALVAALPPVIAPFLFTRRDEGLAATVLAAALVTIASFAGAAGIESPVARGEVLARVLESASAGVALGALGMVVLWFRKQLRSDAGRA